MNTTIRNPESTIRKIRQNLLTFRQPTHQTLIPSVKISYCKIFFDEMGKNFGTVERINRITGPFDLIASGEA